MNKKKINYAKIIFNGILIAIFVQPIVFMLSGNIEPKIWDVTGTIWFSWNIFVPIGILMYLLVILFVELVESDLL
jgi:hypothetical protein